MLRIFKKKIVNFCFFYLLKINRKKNKKKDCKNQSELFFVQNNSEMILAIALRNSTLKTVYIIGLSSELT